ncbi:hypothetical protein HDU87_002752 [Geranomyces variabilis]|uniref:Major facilitator superfamily (MFS) profile domain-containing protein n=1 Tax=Geranomyces variabilis TaxID=109894 RepID=A0AAD5TRU6_9FUNG|nr:hypothetical protein HDU87_002752 [Geranomyces variabilis]
MTQPQQLLDAKLAAAARSSAAVTAAAAISAGLDSSSSNVNTVPAAVYELVDMDAHSSSSDALVSMTAGGAGSASELPPVDRGRGAITFLIAAFIFEFILWGYAGSFGVVQLYLSTHPPFDESSLASIGAVGTTSNGLYFMLPFFLVLLSRRYPHLVRTAVWLALAVNLTSLAASSFAQSVAQLVVLQGIIGGISGAVLYVPIIIYLQEWFSERRGTASGIIFAGTGLGGCALPFLMSFLLEHYGFAWATRIWAIMCAATMGPAIYMLRPRLPVVKPAPFTPFAPVDLSFLTNRVAVPLMLTAFLAGLSWFPVSVMIPTFTAAAGSSAFSANTVLSLLNIASTLGGVLFGYLSDRVGYSWLFIVIGFGEGLFAVASWGTASTLTSIMGFVVLFGLLSGHTSVWNSAARDLASTTSSDAAVIFSSMGVVRGAACLIGPLVAAALYDPSLAKDGSSWGRFGFKGIMVWVAATSFASGIAGWGLGVLQPSAKKAQKPR